MEPARKTITVYDDPGLKMYDTSHGNKIKYLDWCRAEAARITKAGTFCGVVWNKHKMCAVAELSPVDHANN